MPLALYALTAGAFGIGVTGLLPGPGFALLTSMLFPLMAIAAALVAIRASRAPTLSTPIVAS